jgi:hypothetical protein
LSDAAAAVRARPTPGVSRTWLALTYGALTLMTGATSFGSRPYSVYVAAEKHRLAWQTFAQRGRGADERLSTDINVTSYMRRPLMPGLVQLVSVASGLDWPRAFALVRLISIAVAYASLRRLFRLWLDEGGTLAGVLYVAAAAALTFVGNQWEILSDFPEVTLFAVGLHALCTGRPAVVALAVLVGTLNRETMGLMVAFAAADAVVGSRRRESLYATAGALGGWLVAEMAVRSWLAPVIGAHPYATTLRHNLTGLSALVVNTHPYNNFLYPLYLFGPFWVLPLWRRRMLPPCLRAGVLVAPLFLLVVVFLGGLNEPRQLLPLCAVLVPAGMMTLFDQPGASLRRK